MQCFAIFILVTVVAISSQQSTDHERNDRVKNSFSRWDDSQEILDSYEDVRSYPENQSLDWSKRNDHPNQYDEWSTSNADSYRQQQPKLRIKKPKLRVIYKKRYRPRNKTNVHSQSNRDYEFNSSTGRQEKITNKKTYRYKNRSHKDGKHETVKNELNKQRQVNSNSYKRRTKTYRTSEHKDSSHKESNELSDEQESIKVPEVPYGQNALKEIQSASAALIKMLVKKHCGQYEKLEPLDVTTDRAEKENLTAERVDKTSDVTAKETDVTLERADVTTKSAKVRAEIADITSEKSDVATERADVLNEKVDEPAEQADEVVETANASAPRMAVTPEMEDYITAETSERVDETDELADGERLNVTAEKSDATAERADVTAGRADERVDKTTVITAEMADKTAEGAVHPLLLLLRTITKAAETAKRAEKTTDVTTNRADTDVTTIRADVTAEKTDEAAEEADATAEKANETTDRADAERADVIAEGEDKTAKTADVTAYNANLPPKTAEVNAKRVYRLFLRNSAKEMVENDNQMVKVTTERYDTAIDLTELDKLLQVAAERENMAAEYMDHGRPSDVLNERENEQLVLTDLDQTAAVASKQADKTAMRTAQKTIVDAIPDKVIEATPKQSLELNNDEYWLKVKPKQHSDTNGVSEHNPVVNFYYHRLLLDLLAKHKLRAKESDKWKIDKLIALTKNNSGNINPELLHKYLLNQKIIDWDKLLYVNLDVEDTPETLKYYLLIKDTFERFRPDKENVAKFVSSLQNRNFKVHSKLLVLLSEMLRNHEQESPDHPMVVVNDNQKLQELLLQRIQLLYSDKVPLQERKKIALLVKMLQNVKLKTPPRLHNTYLLDYLNSHKPKDIDWDEVFTSIREANNNKSSDENRFKDSKTSEMVSNCDENYKKMRRTVEYILGLMNDKMGVEKLKINS